MDPRIQAAELLTYVGDRRFGHPVFEAVTEGRHAAQERARRTNPNVVHYSSCGDCGHWLLYRMGARFDWLNRAEHGRYRVGKNVNLLAAKTFYGSNELARPAVPGETYAAGDILITGARTPLAHVICVISHEDGVLRTCEYGQITGSLIKQLRIEDKNGKRYIGKKTLDSVLPMYDVLNAAAEAEKLAEPETLEAWRLRLSV